MADSNQTTANDDSVPITYLVGIPTLQTSVQRKKGYESGAMEKKRRSLLEALLVRATTKSARSCISAFDLFFFPGPLRSYMAALVRYENGKGTVTIGLLCMELHLIRFSR